MNGHVKPDEIAMMCHALKREQDFRSGAVVEQFCLTESEWNDLSPRWAYILEKWDRKGWWDYGVSLRTGWLTDAGREALPHAIEEAKRRLALLVKKDEAPAQISVETMERLQALLDRNPLKLTAVLTGPPHMTSEEAADYFEVREEPVPLTFLREIVVDGEEGMTAVVRGKDQLRELRDRINKILGE